MNTYRIYTNVLSGKDCNFGDFAIIGLPPRGYQDGQLPTILGERVEIQSHAVICSGNILGDDSIAGHGLYMRHNNRIGKRAKIGALSVLEANIIIEDDVIIEPQGGIADSTIIEQGGLIGSQTMFASVLHPLCPKAKECERGPHLYRGVTVGGNVTIYPDLRIGEGAYIIPGSVVMRDVRPYAVVAGHPAKEIGDIFTLYPQIVERVKPYINLSQDSVAQTRACFEEEPSLFPAR